MAALDTSPPEPGPIGRWVLAARPRTLPLAVAPVAVGTALAAAHGLLTESSWSPASVREIVERVFNIDPAGGEEN